MPRPSPLAGPVICIVGLDIRFPCCTWRFSSCCTKEVCCRSGGLYLVGRVLLRLNGCAFFLDDDGRMVNRRLNPEKCFESFFSSEKAPAVAPPWSSASLSLSEEPDPYTLERREMERSGRTLDVELLTLRLPLRVISPLPGRSLLRSGNSELFLWLARPPSAPLALLSDPPRLSSPPPSDAEGTEDSLRRVKLLFSKNLGNFILTAPLHSSPG